MNKANIDISMYKTSTLEGRDGFECNSLRNTSTNITPTTVIPISFRRVEVKIKMKLKSVEIICKEILCSLEV